MPRFSLTQLRYQLRYQLRQYRHYRRSRRQLLSLDDRLLDDIGIDRTQALKEGHKAFWKHTPLDEGPYENR
ncbi:MULTISPECIES: DUF1127 domain-containing protein [Halomonadaceae]|uniref:DUF1127 domain-containing protein n=2 Tax=Vreelandella TaxID=3137766 RepID=A0A7Z0LU52_9GAMM|nr:MULTISPECIES: DUF1127 domain-containing protein [Halomonas]AJY49208.1 protein of unknown function DUF1127 [Halomonas sp. KO116]NYS78653.1 DUF1127 domain-containing protein [Halomonas glaciei]|tara:strand:+ start:318 stop:530 length:213 start_codon:yes stop_codon:yes gene_type:complete